ncbi:MAG: hypothetical protein CVU91_12595 [Firmicutes bacterium HGW-Firmicutes-16]|nr:MAG: hypothetical protein CVU91_12595 [Firmicutes bacterium HGW-Firmicutes-16]
MIKSAIICAVLIYGAIIDYKRREIPDIVPIVIVLCGLSLDLSVFCGIVWLTIMMFGLWSVSKLTEMEIPGGDYKLLCALSFTCGLMEIAIILVLAVLGTLFVSMILRREILRKIPLCTYIAPAYILSQAALWGVMAMQ